MRGNVVSCPDLATLATLCAAFVREGVTFEANAESLTITLTGGY